MDHHTSLENRNISADVKEKLSEVAGSDTLRKKKRVTFTASTDEGSPSVLLKEQNSDQSNSYFRFSTVNETTHFDINNESSPESMEPSAIQTTSQTASENRRNNQERKKNNLLHQGCFKICKMKEDQKQVTLASIMVVIIISSAIAITVVVIRDTMAGNNQ